MSQYIQYNRGKQDYKVYANIGQSLVKLSVENLEDPIYFYLLHVFESRVPNIGLHVRREFLKREL